MRSAVVLTGTRSGDIEFHIPYTLLLETGTFVLIH